MIRKRKDPFFVQLGERIRVLRKGSGLTQERLAERADVSVNFIGNAERGESAASVKTLRRFAKALGISLKDLFDFPDEDQGEILSRILALLKSKAWDVEELKGIENLIRIVSQR